MQGKEVVVVPNLVTGCKIWHLREKGSFYPKTAWANTIASLPDGAWVCRTCSRTVAAQSWTHKRVLTLQYCDQLYCEAGTQIKTYYPVPTGWDSVPLRGAFLVVSASWRETGSFSRFTAYVCAQVIFMFGEIDCREGLLLAVDKLKYADMQEAMGVLADIYMEVLTRTVRERDLRIFVHPVPPVLNETRHIVTPFNDLMRERVRLPHAIPCHQTFVPVATQRCHQTSRSALETVPMQG